MVDEREGDAQDGGGDNADQDGLAALLLGQARRRQTDNDGVVAGQNQVDHDDCQKGLDRLGREN